MMDRRGAGQDGETDNRPPETPRADPEVVRFPGPV
jgi:hypothetical protein